MEIDELTEKQQEFVISLKYASSSVENDINDALENASDIDEFKQLAINAMENLAGEPYQVIKQIKELF